MKRKLKLILDILMTLALPCLMAYELIGQETHEILGLCMTAVFILHHILNGSFHKRLFKGKYTAYRTALTVLDGLMAAVFLTQAVTGIMMAKHVLAFLPHVGRRSFARVLHLLGSYWGFAFCGIHAGLHMSGLLRKWWGDKKALPLVLTGAVSAYGVYALIQRNHFQYMFLQEQFVFFDYDEPLILFFLDYAAMIVLFMTLGALLGLALQNIGRRKSK